MSVSDIDGQQPKKRGGLEYEPVQRPVGPSKRDPRRVNKRNGESFVVADRSLPSGAFPQAPTISTFVPMLRAITARFPTGIPEGTTQKHANEALAPGLGIDPRIVGYYSDALCILGFITKDWKRTDHGRALLRLGAYEAQVIRISYAFERTPVARRWVEFQDKPSIDSVDPATARVFVEKYYRGKKENPEETIKSRSSALQRWLQEFKKFRKQPSLPDSTGPAREKPQLSSKVVFDAGGSGEVLRALGRGSNQVAVASGYFSLDGFMLLARSLHRTDMRLLFGAQDAERGEVGALLRVFEASLDPEAGAKLTLREKRKVIIELYEHLVHGRVTVRKFRAKEMRGLHGKLYIFDRYHAYVTSANLTKNGLTDNIETGYVVDDPAAVELYLAKFNGYFERAAPFNEPLIDRIERSWALRDLDTPYIVFLKILDCLYGRAPIIDPRQQPQRLAEYQKAIVARVLAQYMDNKRGVLLISPTGTGKTIMGLQVACALRASRVDRITVICKNQGIYKMWKREFMKCRIPLDHMRFYDLQRDRILREPLAGETWNEQTPAAFAATITDRDLLIVDECHHFRNDESQGYKNLRELLNVGDKSQPHVLLLTATPISKNVENLRTLVRLVTDTNVDFTTLDEAKRCDSLVNVTLGWILKSFGEPLGPKDEIGLRLGSEARFFPRVSLMVHRYQAGMSDVYKLIREMPMEFIYVDLALVGAWAEGEESTPTSVERTSGFLRVLLARRAESSPEALRASLTSLRDGLDTGRVCPVDPERFMASLARLEEAHLRCGNDKIARLVRELGKLPAGQKCLVFTEYKPTAYAVAKKLHEIMDGKVAVVTGDNTPEEKADCLRRFAPIAQGVSGSPADEIMVLVATDSISEGENLQDACWVINYDLPWTPLKLIQRVGRVDRFHIEPRTVQVHNFFPDDKSYEGLTGLWEKVDTRSELVFSLSGTRVLEGTSGRSAEGDAPDLGMFDSMLDGTLDYETIKDVQEKDLPVSEVLGWLWGAEKDDIDAARELPNGARTRILGPTPGLYALIEVDGRYISLFRDSGSGAISCAPDGVEHCGLLAKIHAVRETELIEGDDLDDEITEMVSDWLREQADLIARRAEVIAAVRIVKEGVSAPKGVERPPVRPVQTGLFDM